jgi:hypothetical protein
MFEGGDPRADLKESGEPFRAGHKVRKTGSFENTRLRSLI